MPPLCPFVRRIRTVLIEVAMVVRRPPECPAVLPQSSMPRDVGLGRQFAVWLNTAGRARPPRSVMVWPRPSVAHRIAAQMVVFVTVGATGSLAGSAASAAESSSSGLSSWIRKYRPVRWQQELGGGFGAYVVAAPGRGSNSAQDQFEASPLAFTIEHLGAMRTAPDFNLFYGLFPFRHVGLRFDASHNPLRLPAARVGVTSLGSSDIRADVWRFRGLIVGQIAKLSIVPALGAGLGTFSLQMNEAHGGARRRWPAFVFSASLTAHVTRFFQVRAYVDSSLSWRSRAETNWPVTSMVDLGVAMAFTLRLKRFERELEDRERRKEPSRPVVAIPIRPKPELSMLEPEMPTQISQMLHALDQIFFAFDSAELSFEAIGELDRVVAVLRVQARVGLHIIGHADLRGSESYNDQLSLERAKAVYDYLVAAGIDPTRLRHEGQGERAQNEAGEAAGADAEHRRIEFRLFTIARE